jgi:hypothetical protein
MLAAQLRSRCRAVVLARWQSSAAAERLEAALRDTLATVAPAK